MTGRRLEVVTSLLGRHLLGVPLERIDEINDLPAASGDVGEAIDLAGLWRVAADPGEQRRTITVQTANGPRWVLLGAHARVQRLEASAFMVLPTFIDGLAHHAAISGLFTLDQSMGFMIDVDRLVDRVQP